MKNSSYFVPLTAWDRKHDAKPLRYVTGRIVEKTTNESIQTIKSACDRERKATQRVKEGEMLASFDSISQHMFQYIREYCSNWSHIQRVNAPIYYCVLQTVY